MNLRGLAFLALRVLAIFIFIMGIRHAIALVDYSIPAYLQWTDLNGTQVFVIIGIPTLLLWIIGIVIWFMAGRWSRYLIPASAEMEQLAFRHQNLESFVLSVVGLVIAVTSFADLIRSVLSYVSVANQLIHFDSRSYYYHFAGQAVELILGVVLLFKANGIALLLRKIRGAGLGAGQ